MWIFARKGPSGFSACPTAEEVTEGIDGTGLTAIVTGASSGIGSETTRVLALRGVHVVMADKNTDGGRKVKKAILEEIPNAKLDVMEVDLSSMASVRKFALEFKSLGLPLNLLINNAGVFAPFALTEENIELHFGVNHIGHFLLTNLLLETMKNTARQSRKEGRIVIVSSMGHQFAYGGIQFDKINSEFGYSSMFAYCQSKLANILHANELAKRLKEEGVEITVNSLHPGIIDTNISHSYTFVQRFRPVAKYLIKNTQQGAATTCYVALHPQVNGISGEYFANCKLSEASALAKDAALAKKLWDFSSSLTYCSK